MAEDVRRTLEQRRDDMLELRRVGIWGAVALIAVLIAAIASFSPMGSERIAQLHAPAPPRQPSAAELLAAERERAARAAERDEVRRMAEQIRSLAADRDRLLTRISSLEKNVEGITGSINRKTDALPAAVLTTPERPLPPKSPPTEKPVTETAPAAKTPVTAAPPALPPPAAAPPPAPAVQPPPTSAHAAQQANPAAPEPAAAATAASVLRPLPPPAPAGPDIAAAPLEASADPHREYGIDLGGGTTLAALRSAWTNIHKRHAAELHGLRPFVSLRERGRSGVELRLITGPFETATAAVKTCATLTAAGVACQPTVFDGSKRLALRDAARTPPPLPPPRPSRESKPSFLPRL